MDMVSSFYTEQPSPRFDHQTLLHMFQDSSIHQYLMAKCGLPSIEVHFSIDPHIAQPILQLPGA